MALLSHLRRDLRFNAEFLQLIQTLKNIAASQYHTLEREKERFAEFMDAFAGFFRVVDMVEVDNPFVRPMSDVTGVVLVTSDSGFMGGLNAGVIEAGKDVQGTQPDDKVKFVVIGEKGAMKLSEAGRTFKFFPGVSSETRFEQALEIRDDISAEVLEHRLGAHQLCGRGAQSESGHADRNPVAARRNPRRGGVLQRTAGERIGTGGGWQRHAFAAAHV
jgi:F0F1-type ATP synthase gamma subunit